MVAALELAGDIPGLGHDAADLGGSVELALALAALCGEVPHEILVGVAKDVIVFGAVFREIERRILEDGNKIADLFDLAWPVTKFVWVVKVGEIAAGKTGIGIDQRLDDLSVNQFTDV